MSYCWYCHWGWAKPVAEIYKRALDDLGGDSTPLHYGPAHVVWDDENFDLAQGCLDDFEKYGAGFSERELAIVRRSLEELASLPMEERDIWPDDYDGIHPENYPPSVETVKVWE